MKQAGKRVFVFLTASFLGIIIGLMATCAFGIQKVQGEMMKPAIAGGSFVFVNKWAYLFSEPQQGDIVAFPCSVYSEDGEGSTLIKRVAATEGDTVEIKDGNFFVNNRLYNKYANEPVYMDPLPKTTIESGKVFVLSDNRAAVLDSRDDAVGQLPVADIAGKVCFK